MSTAARFVGNQVASVNIGRGKLLNLPCKGRTVYINGFKAWSVRDSMTFDTTSKNTFQISLSSSSTFFAVVTLTCNELAIRPSWTDIFTFNKVILQGATICKFFHMVVSCNNILGHSDDELPRWSFSLSTRVCGKWDSFAILHTLQYLVEALFWF